MTETRDTAVTVHHTQAMGSVNLLFGSEPEPYPSWREARLFIQRQTHRVNLKNPIHPKSTCDCGRWLENTGKTHTDPATLQHHTNLLVLLFTSKTRGVFLLNSLSILQSGSSLTFSKRVALKTGIGVPRQCKQDIGVLPHSCWSDSGFHSDRLDGKVLDCKLTCRVPVEATWTGSQPPPLPDVGPALGVSG